MLPVYKAVVDVELVIILSLTHVRVFLSIVESASNPLKMSSSNKKRKKNFLNKLRCVFKRKDEELEEQSDFYIKQERIFDSRQTDHSESAACRSDQQVAKAIGSEIDATVPKNSLSGKEEHNDKNLSDMKENYKNVVTVKSESSRLPKVGDDKSENHQKYNVTKNKQGDSKLGSDRYMSTKIAFLKRDNEIGVSFRSSLGDIGKIHHDNETKIYNPDYKNAILQSFSNNASITIDTRKFLVKETKAISQESSEDSDFSADSTEDLFEDSSEDENEHLIESRKYFKDEYFTKGKYITYFFLEMERQFYNPTDVYNMIQYHDTDYEKPGKEGTK